MAETTTMSPASPLGRREAEALAANRCPLLQFQETTCQSYCQTPSGASALLLRGRRTCAHLWPSENRRHQSNQDSRKTDFQGKSCSHFRNAYQLHRAPGPVLRPEATNTQRLESSLCSDSGTRCVVEENNLIVQQMFQQKYMQGNRSNEFCLGVSKLSFRGTFLSLFQV